MYEAKNFEHLIGTPGFSEKLLTTHFGLYQGYVKATNALMDKLSDMLKAGKQSTPEYHELKRRYGWEFNGMRLHELYFGNMSKEGSRLGEGELMTKLSAAYGDYAVWEKDFIATSSLRGIGWVVLYYDKQADRVFNVWINEHDAGHFSGCVPLLVLDVFEHAFFLDYGAKRGDYIDAFMKAIAWGVVKERLI